MTYIKPSFLSFVLLLTAACFPLPAVPTPVLPAPTPQLPLSPQPPVPSPQSPTPRPTGHPLDVPPDDWVSALWTPTPAVAGIGLRPEQIPTAAPMLYAFPDPNPLRLPPAYEVPLSLHPFDHYWLARPIPSDKRNYEHPSYPYGNDLFIAGQEPYPIHHGLDFPNPTGTPILAAGSGVVLWAGPLINPPDGVNYYGNAVVIHHDWQWRGQDVFTLYAHTLELFVAVGDQVDQGQLIAGVGASGNATGPHLHLEVRIGVNDYYQSRNPALWLVPFEGYGTLAGRFVDGNGALIANATVNVYPDGHSGPVRVQRTYISHTVTPDDVWFENFAVGDLPAGRYEVLIRTDTDSFRQSVEILPGQTTFMVVEEG